MTSLDLIGLTLDEAKEKIISIMPNAVITVSETRSKTAEVTEDSPCHVIRQKIDGNHIHLTICYF